jgi:spermidine/putrescine transport system ATP-binding protein
MSDQVAVMNQGRFEQVGRPQQLYYEPASAFVAGFVGHNNRVEGRVDRIDGELVTLRTADGLALRGRRAGNARGLRAGDAAQIFVRPEAIEIGRAAGEFAQVAEGLRWHARVQSVLFDGGNSTVQVREDDSGQMLHIALPLTGRLADLRAGDAVLFSYRPEQAWCFAA